MLEIMCGRLLLQSVYPAFTAVTIEVLMKVCGKVATYGRDIEAPVKVCPYRL